jgi:hypothetical protein
LVYEYTFSTIKHPNKGKKRGARGEGGLGTWEQGDFWEQGRLGTGEQGGIGNRGTRGFLGTWGIGNRGTGGSGSGFFGKKVLVIFF